jgi:hypothetical protein
LSSRHLRYFRGPKMPILGTVMGQKIGTT